MSTASCTVCTELGLDEYLSVRANEMHHISIHYRDVAKGPRICRRRKVTFGFWLWNCWVTCCVDMPNIFHTKSILRTHDRTQFSSFILLALQVQPSINRNYPRADMENRGPRKPIETNHATWAVVNNDRNLPTVKGRKNWNHALVNFAGTGGRYFAAFPTFHVSSGIYW